MADSQNILIGAEAFMSAFSACAASAKGRVLVQAMTFEGDEAGLALMDVLKSSPATDKRLCVDRYSSVVVNDRFVFSTKYLRDGDFRREIRQGKELLKSAEQFGVGIWQTNPTGPMLLRYPFRNHKKMVVCDDTVFLGGINFSDHNFAWHDMMLRIDDPGLAEILAADFDQNFKGIKTEGTHSYNDGEVLFLKRKSAQWDRLFDYFRQARKSISIVSPYVSWPLLDLLKNEVDSRVNITIISPETNNKSLFKKNLLHEAANGYFDLRLYQHGMSHLKAVLIDNSTLIAGSSNYDFASYLFEEEVVITNTNPKVVQDFRQNVLFPMMDASKLLPSDDDRCGRHGGSSKMLSLLVHSLKRLSG